MKGSLSYLIQGVYFFGITPYDFSASVHSPKDAGVFFGKFLDNTFGWAVILDFKKEEKRLTFKLRHIGSSAGPAGHAELLYSLLMGSNGLWSGKITDLEGRDLFNVNVIITEVLGSFFEPF